MKPKKRKIEAGKEDKKEEEEEESQETRASQADVNVSTMADVSTTIIVKYCYVRRKPREACQAYYQSVGERKEQQ